VISYLSGYTEEAPLSYVEFKLACMTGWDIDHMDRRRVDDALRFLALEVKYKRPAKQP
jgi:hypothetical protein